MKEIGIFEGWVNCLSEGTWALPDTPEKQQKLIQLLADELPVGPDATNATELLYDLIGDDDLFDQLGDLAREDANADARTVVINKLEQMSSNPAIAQVIGKLKVEKAAPAPEAPPADAEPVAEDQICETCHQAVCECGMHESIEEQIQSLAELSGTGMKRVFHNGQWVDPKTLKKPVNELSRDTLKSYIKKAGSSSDERSASNLASRAAHKLANPEGDDDGNDDDEKSYLRSKGIARAVDKLEELSPSTLGSYIKKASSDRAMKNFDQGVDMGTSMNDRVPKFDAEKDRKDDQRRSGIHKAVNRLVKEEDTDWAEYERRVSALERKGLSRSDAQGVVDAEMMQVKEASDTVKLDPKTGKPTAWSHEGDWKKVPKRNGKPVDPRGEVTNMVGQELKKAKGLKEGGMSEADLLFQEIARGNVDIYNIYASPKTAVEKFVSDQIHDRVEEISRERGIPEDDDIDKILEIIFNDLGDEYGVDESVGGGNFLESRPNLDDFKNDNGEVDWGKYLQAQANINTTEYPEYAAKMKKDGNKKGIADKFKDLGFGDEMSIRIKEDSEPTVYEIYQTRGCRPSNAVVRTFSANTPEEAQADLENFIQRRPDVDPSYFDVRELTDAGKHLDQLRQARERKPALEETTALTGQYGHTGKLQAVQGTDADMMDRIRFLAGITK